MERWLAMAALAALTLLGGCTAMGDSNPAYQAEQIYADGLCGRTRTEPAARWIASAEELETIRRQFGSYRLGPPKLPAVDFETRGVLLVFMGKRRTAGYGLALVDSAGSPADGVARVNLEWRRPDPDAMTAQVLTSPCAMFTLPRAGLERIDVHDQTGGRRLSVTPGQ